MTLIELCIVIVVRGILLTTAVAGLFPVRPAIWAVSGVTPPAEPFAPPAQLVK